jgi:hypothetical protein
MTLLPRCLSFYGSLGTIYTETIPHQAIESKARFDEKATEITSIFRNYRPLLNTASCRITGFAEVDLETPKSPLLGYSSLLAFQGAFKGLLVQLPFSNSSEDI